VGHVILYPAIDLKDGKCVRLAQGDMGTATIFNDDPVAQAELFLTSGANWIHVVDLNGALEGMPVNVAAVEAIVAAASCPIQLGGGIRDIAIAGRWFDAGVSRIVLGTAAIKDPAFVREACKQFPNRVAVGIDARAGRVAVEGWAETSEVTADDLAKRFEDVGVAAIVHTDIERDGLMIGPNVEASAVLADAVSIPIIVSGGVSSLRDLRVIKRRAVSTPGLAGVISGRALYEGRINLSSALALLAD